MSVGSERSRTADIDAEPGQGNEVILVVEDDVALRELIKNRLVASGHRTAGATNGAGVPPASIERVFDRLFTTKPDGMGMGLSISQSAIKYHGGRLWVTSSADRGSTFRFTFPTDRGEPARGE